MNKEIWINYTNDLPCPRCEHGHLQDVGKDQGFETLESRIENEFQPGGIVSPSATFLVTGHIQCSKCKEVVICSYRRIEDVRHLDEQGYEVPFLEPLYYMPSPPIIKIPFSCPREVANLLRVSFQIYWVDLGSCANKIRISIECLMNLLEIPANANLHSRIEDFKNTNETVGDLLLAIKWIGNSGSHHADITKDAVLDGYEMLEYALERLYNDREQRLITLSQKINLNKKHL